MNRGWASAIHPGKTSSILSRSVEAERVGFPMAEFGAEPLLSRLGVVPLVGVMMLLVMLSFAMALRGGGARSGGVEAARGPEMRAYTAAEVAKHCTRESMWVIIDGKVYDLTEYVDQHEGGSKAIMKHAGGDASVGFHGPQHPPKVDVVIEDFLIGTLAEKEE